MVRVIKRKEQLVAQLKHVADSKRTQLMAQQAQLEARLKGLDAFYAETQTMMKDVDFNASKRKIKILSQGKALLGAHEVDVKPATNNKIVLNIDAEALTDILARTGTVLDGNGALPPTLEMKEVAARAATVVVRSHEDEKECSGHKVEYAECENGGAVEDDEKVEWKVVEVDNNSNDAVEHVLSSLRKYTNCAVLAASNISVGWGPYHASEWM